MYRYLRLGLSLSLFPRSVGLSFPESHQPGSVLDVAVNIADPFPALCYVRHILQCTHLWQRRDLRDEAAHCLEGTEGDRPNGERHSPGRRRSRQGYTHAARQMLARDQSIRIRDSACTIEPSAVLLSRPVHGLLGQDSYRHVIRNDPSHLPRQVSQNTHILAVL